MSIGMDTLVRVVALKPFCGHGVFTMPASEAAAEGES